MALSVCVCQEQYLFSSRSDERMEWKRNFLLREQTYNRYTALLTRPRHTGTHVSMTKQISNIHGDKPFYSYLNLPVSLVDLN